MGRFLETQFPTTSSSNFTTKSLLAGKVFCGKQVLLRERRAPPRLQCHSHARDVSATPRRWRLT